MSLDDLVLEKIFTPPPSQGPEVTLERGTVTSAGRVKTALDVEGQRIDGATDLAPAGSVLTVGGHRIFIPYFGGVGTRIDQLGTDMAAAVARITALEAATTPGAWIPITLPAGLTGFLRLRRIGPQVEVAVSLSGTFTVGNIVRFPAGTIPATFRPTEAGCIAVCFRGGYPGIFTFTAAGGVEIANQSGANRTAAYGRTVGWAVP